MDPGLHAAFVGTDRRLHGISVVRLSRRVFRTVQLHRNNRFYRFLLGICRLIHDSLLVDEVTGEVQFRDFVRDDRRMRLLFKRFLRNFYRREQADFAVERGARPVGAHDGVARGHEAAAGDGHGHQPDLGRP